MDDSKPGGCPQCAELQKRIAELTARQEKLEAELARAKKNSSTSSKPPSSDIVKPPKPAPKGKGKRKQGAQPGHPRHQRAPFSLDEIDKTWDYCLTVCPDCGGHSNSRPFQCDSSWFAHFDSGRMIRHHRDVEKDLRDGLPE